MADGTRTTDLPRIIAGRYEVERVLAEGGMGLVCLGRQLGLDRQVAIKFLRPGRLGDVAIARFKREAEVAKRLTHPNTVRLYDFGETDDQMLFLVMEHLQGRTLEDELSVCGPMPPDRVVRLGRQILKSLVEAHALGIVHRDIKPSNVMLCEQVGEADFVKVLDFGVAHLPGATHTKATADGAMIGTPSYMAPEQARREEVDPRGDLYSLGLTLIELLTGQPAVGGDSPLDVALEHASHRPVQVPPEILETELGRVLRRAVEKEREKRHSTALAMLDELERAGHLEASAAVLQRTPSAPTPPHAPARPRPHSDTALEESARTSDEGRASAARFTAQEDLGTDPGARGAEKISVVTPAPAAPPTRTSRRWPRVAVVAAALVGGVVVAWLLLQPSAPAPVPAPAVPDLTQLRERRLTTLAMEVRSQSAALSQDGRTFVYVNPEGFWVQDVDADQAELLPYQEPLMNGFGWYPDGRRLLVSEERSDGFGPMWELDRFTGERRLVHPEAGNGTVSPDGAWIAYQTEIGISVMSTGGQAGELVVAGVSQELRLLSWSPDGTYIAFGRSGNTNSLNAATRDGSQITEIARGPELGSRYYGTSAAWVDANHILYTRPYGEGEQATDLCLTAFPNPTEPPTCVARWPDAVGLYSDVQGGRVLIDRTEVAYDVYVAEIGLGGALVGTPRRLTLDDRPDVPGPWMSATRLALLGSRNQRWRLLAQDIGATTAELVPADRTATEAWAAVDADGQPLIWRSRRTDGGQDVGCALWRRPDGGPEALLATLDPERPCYDTDTGIGHMLATATFELKCAGVRCVLAERWGEILRFALLDSRSGQVGEPFYHQSRGVGPTTWSLSPDGERLAVLRAGAPDVTLVSIAAPEQPTAITLRPTGYMQFVGFDGTGQGLYLTGMNIGEASYGLLHCDLLGSCQVLWSSEHIWIHTPSVSPDGRTLALGMLTLDSDLWLLELGRPEE